MTSVSTAASLETKLTSLASLFNQTIGQHWIREIEIPIIQRDYAQGRRTASVDRIRTQFIDTVCRSVFPETDSIELDFVYGDVDADGKFFPLDGQQRLTLLFLLHCYLSWRANIDVSQQGWTKFSYATRPGARDFCKFLTEQQPDFSGMLSDWITDQADYLPTWNFDPTIQSMLVVLESLHAWFSENGNQVDFSQAWQKLTRAENPAIQFHLLPMSAIGMTDVQYIKMNSRGKPLTPFENFKARFEDIVRAAAPDKAQRIAKKIDTDWSDILWNYRGGDNQIDDEFMRYVRFVTEICAWNSNVEFSAKERVDDFSYLNDLAERVFGPAQQKSDENLEFLCHAFDVWHGRNVRNEFESIFAAGNTQNPPRVTMFSPFKDEGVDLFHACCRHYGSREWDLAHTLLLYGFLLRWSISREQEDEIYIEVKDFKSRLRVLRNLIEASRGDEIRAGERNNMPALIKDVREVISSGDIAKVDTFNQAQKQNELDKAATLKFSPALEAIMCQLEDHDFLRGGLRSFDLEPSKFQARAEKFLEIFDKTKYSGVTPWIDVSGALLAQGDYSRKGFKRWTGYSPVDLGAPRNDEPWQTLFRGKGQKIHSMCQPLMRLLDRASQGATLQQEMNAYVNTSVATCTWQYYFVKYPEMRQGASGRFAMNDSGYEACMLDKERVSSYYSDPYLRALVALSGLGFDEVTNPQFPDLKWPNAYYGYESQQRWLEIKSCGIRLRSVDCGWEVTNVSNDPQALGALQTALLNIQGVTVTTAGSMTIVQINQHNDVDAVDRIAIAAALIQRLSNKLAGGSGVKN